MKAHIPGAISFLSIRGFAAWAVAITTGWHFWMLHDLNSHEPRGLGLHFVFPHRPRNTPRAWHSSAPWPCIQPRPQSRKSNYRTGSSRQTAQASLPRDLMDPPKAGRIDRPTLHRSMEGLSPSQRQMRSIFGETRSALATRRLGQAAQRRWVHSSGNPVMPSTGLRLGPRTTHSALAPRAITDIPPRSLPSLDIPRSLPSIRPSSKSTRSKTATERVSTTRRRAIQRRNKRRL